MQNKPEINKLHVVQFTAEFSSQYLIILYMNEMAVLSFEVKGGQVELEHPDILSSGSVVAAYQGKVLSMLWTLNYADNPYGLEVQLIVFNADKPAAAIVGSNGRPLAEKEKVHSFPVNFNSAKQLATDIATYFIQNLKGEI